MPREHAGGARVRPASCLPGGGNCRATMALHLISSTVLFARARADDGAPSSASKPTPRRRERRPRAASGHSSRILAPAHTARAAGGDALGEMASCAGMLVGHLGRWPRPAQAALRARIRPGTRAATRGDSTLLAAPSGAQPPLAASGTGLPKEGRKQPAPLKGGRGADRAMRPGYAGGAGGVGA